MVVAHGLVRLKKCDSMVVMPMILVRVCVQNSAIFMVSASIIGEKREKEAVYTFVFSPKILR